MLHAMSAAFHECWHPRHAILHTMSTMPKACHPAHHEHYAQGMPSCTPSCMPWALLACRSVVEGMLLEVGGLLLPSQAAAQASPGGVARQLLLVIYLDRLSFHGMSGFHVGPRLFIP